MRVRRGELFTLFAEEKYSLRNDRARHEEKRSARWDIHHDREGVRARSMSS